MSSSLSRTVVSAYARCLVTDSTASSYTDPVAQAAAPSADGVVDVAGVYGQVANQILLKPFGTGNAAQTFNLRIHGWSKTASGLWTPETLLELTCTLGTKVGVAGHSVLATNKFCDTVVGATTPVGLANVTSFLLSPTGNLFGTARFFLQGCRYFQVEVKVGTAAGGNALWRAV